MKKNILIGTFIASLFVASCNKVNIPDNISISGKRITVSANISKDAQSKLSYSDDTTSKTFKMSWSAKESFIVYRGKSSDGQVFSNENNGGSKFEGTAPAVADGKYYAVYGCADTSNTNGVLTVDIANQKGDTTENGIRSFMVAESDNLDSATTFKFNHKLAILKLNLTFPEGTKGTVKEIIVTGLHNKASYTLLSNNYGYTDDNKKDIKATNNGSGFTIKDSIITAYVSVFPEVVKAKQVTITAVIGEGAEAVDYSYTMQNAKTLNLGSLVPVSVELIKMKDNFKSAYTKSDYYMWDAYESCDKPEGSWEKGSSRYNPTKTDLASQSCKDCPTAQQMVAYLKAGVYWDDNTAVTEGQKTYTLKGATKHTGLWLKKRRYIENFYSETSENYGTTFGTTFNKLSKLTNEEVKNIRTSGEYFFLPACGGYLSGSFDGAGTSGYYWSSTPTAPLANYAYYLFFNSGYAYVDGGSRYYSRNCGYVPMPRL